MTVTVNNILQQVITYNMANIAFMENNYCFYASTNKKFENFQNIKGNLGQTVSFELPPRFTLKHSLVWTAQAIQQRTMNLTVDTPWSSTVEYTEEQFIYNVKEYMQRVGSGLVRRLGSGLEQWLGLNFVSGVPVMVNEVPTGALHTESGPYRYVGSASTALTTYQQCALFVTQFKNYGYAPGKIRGYISDFAYPAIVGSGLNSFIQNKNNETINSWDIGNFSECDWHKSNLLPVHVSGNCGNDGTVLTVVSTNDSTGSNITQITFSGATASDANAIFSGDLGRFLDGVSGQPDLRYLNFETYSESGIPVQIRALGNVGASSGGIVVVNIVAGSAGQGLCSQAGNPNQNIKYNIVAGMQFKFEASHKAGLIYSGDTFYLGMPQLGNQRPFDTSYKMDPDVGAGWRLTYGSILGQNQTLLGMDGISGSVLVPENCARILLPLSQ